MDPGSNPCTLVPFYQLTRPKAQRSKDSKKVALHTFAKKKQKKNKGGLLVKKKTQRQLIPRAKKQTKNYEPDKVCNQGKP